MNKHMILGLALVAVAVGLAIAFAGASVGTAAGGLFGKAVWYLPYLALVGGVDRLARARR